MSIENRTAREQLLAGLRRVIPSGEEGDKIRVYLLRLIEGYRDEYAAQQIEAHARPNPSQTRPRGFGGKDLSKAKRGEAS